MTSHNVPETSIINTVVYMKNIHVLDRTEVSISGRLLAPPKNTSFLNMNGITLDTNTKTSEGTVVTMNAWKFGYSNDVVNDTGTTQTINNANIVQNLMSARNLRFLSDILKFGQCADAASLNVINARSAVGAFGLVACFAFLAFFSGNFISSSVVLTVYNFSPELSFFSTRFS
ncbi:hypothetical protein AX774_g6922 [Zancudomyces culisetae]|uniref:Uncharacterized protein n=1 Tax=Zancudomyces culisetae TaxID=1213189 RepID=A0A1R1PFF9_ZANCU|nr:hypothetical protein AX774_g6922 [Zancudomyces culisetae]|eukprot:OMH79659.1 hypothetical protein AX774_g6922 [Zancudomyces culisetae]